MAAKRSVKKTTPLRRAPTRTPARRNVAAPRAGTAAMPMPAALYKASSHPDLVEVPRRTVLCLEGRGAPAAPKFQACVGALYGVAFGLKFRRRKLHQGDFKVGPLEALWWVDDDKKPFMSTPRGLWHWRLRMAVPDGVTKAELNAVIKEATALGKGGAVLNSVHLEVVPAMEMGRMLHVGPYAGEVVSFEALRLMLTSRGRMGRNRHIEVYLSDPRRTSPSRLKTVLLLETRRARRR